MCKIFDVEKKDYIEKKCCFTQEEGEITGLERNKGYDFDTEIANCWRNFIQTSVGLKTTSRQFIIACNECPSLSPGFRGCTLEMG